MFWSLCLIRQLLSALPSTLDNVAENLVLGESWNFYVINPAFRMALQILLKAWEVLVCFPPWQSVYLLMYSLLSSSSLVEDTKM